MGILPLHIETGRYKNVFDGRETGIHRKMNVNEITCKCNVCKLDIVEDEQHFLKFNCNIYYDERWESYEECAKLFRNFSDMINLKILCHINVGKLCCGMSIHCGRKENHWRLCIQWINANNEWSSNFRQRHRSFWPKIWGNRDSVFHGSHIRGPGWGLTG